MAKLLCQKIIGYGRLLVSLIFIIQNFGDFYSSPKMLLRLFPFQISNIENGNSENFTIYRVIIEMNMIAMPLTYQI